MSRGFTLIEVVVSLVVAALVLGAAAQLLSSSARHAKQVRDYIGAITFAESKLTQAGVADALVPGVAAGALEDGLRWRRRVEPLLPPDQVAAAEAGWVPYRVSVEVQWDGERTVSLSTIRLGRAP
jgi:prepilin-type N-terminal cleavage/methylation domain-containing protein